MLAKVLINIYSLFLVVPNGRKHFFFLFFETSTERKFYGAIKTDIHCKSNLDTLYFFSSVKDNNNIYQTKSTDIPAVVKMYKIPKLYI